MIAPSSTLQLFFSGSLALQPLSVFPSNSLIHPLCFFCPKPEGKLSRIVSVTAAKIVSFIFILEVRFFLLCYRHGSNGIARKKVGSVAGIALS
jgi:hypothetical protein